MSILISFNFPILCFPQMIWGDQPNFIHTNLNILFSKTLPAKLCSNWLRSFAEEDKYVKVSVQRTKVLSDGKSLHCHWLGELKMAW
jgi:hypothetical protein